MDNENNSKEFDNAANEESNKNSETAKVNKNTKKPTNNAQRTVRANKKSEVCPDKKCKFICTCICILVCIITIIISISINIGCKMTKLFDYSFNKELYVFLLCLAQIVVLATTLICATYLTAKIIDKKNKTDSKLVNSLNNIASALNEDDCNIEVLSSAKDVKVIVLSK